MNRLLSTKRSWAVFCAILMGGLLGPAAKADAAVSCGKVSLQSLQNGKYVSVEVGWSGNFYAMLRARATKVGPWELFDMCRHSEDGSFSLKSRQNNLYVMVQQTAQGQYQYVLRAIGTSAYEYPRFLREGGESPAQSLRSLANGMYVSAEVGYTGDNNGLLRARASSRGPWELFAIAIR